MVAVAVVLSGLAGCAQAPDESGRAKSGQPGPRVSAAEKEAGQKLQAGLRSDGVSKQDYETAVQAVEKCLSRRDIDLVDYGWNPVHSQRKILFYRNTDLPEDVVGGYGTECSAAYLQEVEAEYAETTSAVMEPELLLRSHQCIAKNGIGIHGSEKNLEQLTHGRSPDEQDRIFDCVTEATQQLYPDFPVPVTM